MSPLQGESAERGTRTPTLFSELRILSPPRLPIPPSRQLKFIIHTHISLHTTFPAYCKIKIFPAYKTRDVPESCAYSQFRHLGSAKRSFAAHRLLRIANSNFSVIARLDRAIQSPLLPCTRAPFLSIGEGERLYKKNYLCQ